jgi:SEC-C motif-containing protein
MLKYAECCRPFHRNEREPPTAQALMRSRFSAFAKKELEYLWKTLHPHHADRARPKEEVLQELRTAGQRFKYVGLEIRESQEALETEPASVTFHARLFESGQDRSFTETSTFRHDGTGWRYLSGVIHED